MSEPNEVSIEAAAFGDRMRQIVELVRFLRGFEGVDFSQFQDLMAAVWAIGTADGLRAKIVAGLEVLKVLSLMTPGETDDKIVAVIDKISEPLLDLLELIVSNYLPGTQAHILDADMQRQVEAAGIPWSLILMLAKLLAQLIGALKK